LVTSKKPVTRTEQVRKGKKAKRAPTKERIAYAPGKMRGKKGGLSTQASQ